MTDIMNCDHSNAKIFVQTAKVFLHVQASQKFEMLKNDKSVKTRSKEVHSILFKFLFDIGY